MTLTLRPYQQEAVQAIYDHFGKSDDNCLLVVPTRLIPLVQVTPICGARHANESLRGHSIW